MNRRISILVLPILAAGALAQNTTENDELPDVRRYTVEMIIFSYAQNVSAGNEIFVPDLPPAEDLLIDDGELDPIDELPIAVLDEVKKFELVMLPEEDFSLVETYEHLQRLDAYEPLMHFGWTQPTYSGEEVDARPLSSFVTPPDGLQGDLTMYLSRYLHLSVNLQLDAPSTDEADEVAPYGVYEDRVSYPVRYRIEEDRIFRNGELRYFDHPKFGVLAKITRIEEDETLQDDLNGEMLGYPQG